MNPVRGACVKNMDTNFERVDSLSTNKLVGRREVVILSSSGLCLMKQCLLGDGWRPISNASAEVESYTWSKTDIQSIVQYKQVYIRSEQMR